MRPVVRAAGMVAVVVGVFIALTVIAAAVTVGVIGGIWLMLTGTMPVGWLYGSLVVGGGFAALYMGVSAFAR